MNEQEIKDKIIAAFGLKTKATEDIDTILKDLASEISAAVEDAQTQALLLIEDARKKGGLVIDLADKEVQKIATKAFKAAEIDKVYITDGGKPFHAKNHCIENTKGFYFECEKVGTQTKITKTQK